LNRGLNKQFYISRHKLKIVSGFKSFKSKISNPISNLGLIEIYFKNENNILEVKGIRDIVGETPIQSESIYKFGLSVCLSVCLYPINVKTAEPIGPKFCVGPHVTPGKVYE